MSILPPRGRFTNKPFFSLSKQFDHIVPQYPSHPGDKPCLSQRKLTLSFAEVAAQGASRLAASRILTTTFLFS